MSTFDFDVIGRSLSYVLLTGLRFTLLLTLLSAAGGLALGTLLALLRLSGNPVLGWLVAAYVNLVRSLPLVLVIFWFFFLVPYLAQWLTGARRPVQVGAFASALITFIVFEAAYFSEIIRAGIGSIARGQSLAGLAIGLRPWQVTWYVVLPQVFRIMAPVMLTQTIILFQDTSLVYVLGLVDLLGAASQVAQRDGRLVEMYLFVAVVYFAISFTASRGVTRLQAAVAVPR
ncbi:MAG: amino acid ABC transporter permease [Janthinobacterium lividum]